MALVYTNSLLVSKMYIFCMRFEMKCLVCIMRHVFRFASVYFESQIECNCKIKRTAHVVSVKIRFQGK